MNNQKAVPTDKQTRKWVESAANQGHAIENLTEQSVSKYIKSLQQKIAYKWYKKSASPNITTREKGFADAQYNLGVMYLKGEGVDKNDKVSAKWFRMAAQQGHADAQYNLGLLFKPGKG